MTISVKPEISSCVSSGDVSVHTDSGRSSDSNESVINHVGTQRDKNNLSLLQSFILNTDSSQNPKRPLSKETIFVKREIDTEYRQEPHVPNATGAETSSETIPPATQSKAAKKHRKVSNKNAAQKRQRTEHSIVEPTSETRTSDVSAETIPRNPAPLHRLHALLFDISKLPDPGAICNMTQLIESVFEEVKEDEGMDFCLKQTGLSLTEWIQEGERLTKRHAELVAQLVELRIGLSYKFKIIVDLINEHAEHLIIQEKQLDEKLIKIRSIGRDMLNLL